MPEPGRHGPRRSVARFPVLVVLLGALVVAGLIDRAATPPRAAASAPVPPVPVAAPASALSSSWFCAGATDNRYGRAPGAVVIANDGTSVARGAVTFVPNSGRNVVVPVAVGPRGRAIMPETVPHGASWIGAIVDIDSGAVAVGQQVTSSLGGSASPCATTGSNSWYFASGATLINSTVVLSLLNPYPTAAVVDLTFTTNEGVEQPQAFQGLVVPAAGLIDVNLGTHLRRRQFIATTVTARAGRVVAWKTDVVTPPASGSVLVGTPAANNPLADPAAPVAGVRVTLGSPSLSTRWVWPDGFAGGGLDERYVVYNPGATTANLHLSVALDEGTAEPFDISVGPGQVTSVISEQEARIPPGVGYSAVLTSQNGVPVVAERTLAASSPSIYSGLGEMAGEQLASAQWLVPVGTQSPTVADWLIVYNPGSTRVAVSVAGLAHNAATPVGPASVTVQPGRRWAIRVGLGNSIPDEPVVVFATSPVYVQANLYGLNGTPGVGLESGVPLTP